MLKTKNNRVKFFLTTAIFLVFFVVVFLFSNTVLAQNDLYGTNYAENVGLSSTDIRITVVKVIRTILGVLGILALIIILYGGFVWMTSGGNQQKIETAKKILLNALIGLIIIMMAFAIVQFIFSALSGGGNSSSQSYCVPDQCYGCMRCQADQTNYLFDESCDYNSCQGGLPSNSFTITGVQTSHAGTTDKDDVYWCSKIQTLVNHNTNPDTVTQAAASNDLRIAVNSGSAPGDWATRGSVFTFTPQNNEFTNRNTGHTEHVPTTIEDTDGRFVSDCSLTAGCEGTPPPDYRWDFYVGDEGDLQSPYITNTYPQSSDPDNPDTNVSREPVIDVTFSEQIDATTVLDVNGLNPYPGHIYLYELDGENGNIVQQISNNLLIIEIKNNGFRLRLDPPNLLKEFTYYQVIVQDIEDLCGNIMDPNNYTWQFATNDRAPGVSSYYPTGDNVCPDTKVSISYNTSMYYNRITFSIEQIGGSGPSSYIVEPSNGSNSTTNNVGPGNIAGEFKVADADPNNISTHYKVFDFIPSSSLDENTKYHISVVSDKIIDANGNSLNHSWEFTVTDLQNCVCQPYISRLSKDQGPKGECLTIYGQCFTGTQEQPADISHIYFDSTDADIPPNSDYTNTAVATTVPDNFNHNDRPQITIAIAYQSGNDVPPSNGKEFLVTAGTANGPCLWSVRPDSGEPGNAQVTLTGIRFGDFASQTTHQAIFNSNAIFNVTNASDWLDTKITNVTVPASTIDGDVVVKNDLGTSNGIPFNAISCGDGSLDPGEECDGANLGGKDCANFGWVGGILGCYPAGSTDAQGNSNQCRFDQSQCSNAPGVVENSQCILKCQGGPKDGEVCYTSNDCLGDPNSSPPVADGQCNINTLPSPNPYKNAKDVCLNAVMSADFNTDINTASITQNNIFYQKCNTDDCQDDNTDPANPIIGLEAAHLPADLTTSGKRSLRLTPKNNLDKNTTYQVTIRGGAGGITSEAGIVMENDYIWHYKTKNEDSLCAIDKVYLEPKDNSLGANEIDDTYHASAIAPYSSTNCTIVNGNSYDWLWSIDDNNNPQIGVNVTEDLADDSNAIVKAGTKQGSVYVRAATENKYDRGHLRVSFDTCAYDPEICNKNCPGSVCDLTADRCTPVIQGLSPASGPVERWVTVKGCYFKNSRGSGNVYFDNTPVANYPCQGKWTDKEILVEVPNTLSLGSYAVNLTDMYKLSSNNSANGNKDFQVTNNCSGVAIPSSAVPGICSINPNSGIPNDTVNINGENFGSATSTVTFNGVSAPISEWNWENNNLIKSQVPHNATDGDVIVSVDNCPSNGLYFDIKSGNVGDPCDGNIGNKDENNQPVCDADNNMCWSGLYCEPAGCTCQVVPKANIIESSRYPYPTTDCLNTSISATFDTKMNRSTINSNTIQVWQRFTDISGKNDCLLDSEYASVFENKSNIFNKLVQLFKKIFNLSSAKAQSQEIGWCQISGRVTSYNINQGDNTVFTFSPYRPFEYKDPRYIEVHIKAGQDGVKTSLGGEINTKTPTRKSIGPSYYWAFTLAKNQICQIDHVDVTVNTALNTREKATTDFFTCAKQSGCADDIKPDDQNSGNQHQYIAKAYDKDGNEITAAYQWSEYDNENLIEIAPLKESQTFVTANPFDGESIARVTAGDNNFNDDYRQGTSTTAVNITNALCQNPWPSLEEYPFEDNTTNCNSGGTDCMDFTFSTYYCRDYGNMTDYCDGGTREGLECDISDTNSCPGGVCRSSTYDDLPALNMGRIKGVANGYCVGGTSHGKTCTNDSSCGVGSYCSNVLKDFLFTFPIKVCQGTANTCTNDSQCSGNKKCLDNNIRWCGGANKICTIDDDCLADDSCQKNIDSIGIRIYRNDEHFSAPAWYEKYAHNPGSYSRKEIDSYEAVSSGRTNYISFAVDKDPVGIHNIFTDMFLISHSDNYQAVTLNIYQQLIDNLKFNARGPDNVRECEATGAYCSKDSDCAVNKCESNQCTANGKNCATDADCQDNYCNAGKDKLARDVIRIGHLNEMKYQLEKYRGYCTGHQELACQQTNDCPLDKNKDHLECVVQNNTYPLLEAGTYIQGSSVSVWDSWGDTFASLLGSSPLIDPINEVFCDNSGVYNDECWDKDAKKFECNTGSHFYHYQAAPDGQSYNLYANMEYSDSGWQPEDTTIGSSPFCSP